MREDQKQMLEAIDKIADDIAVVEKMAAESPVLVVNDKVITRLHQLAAKLRDLQVTGMLGGKPDSHPGGVMPRVM